MTVTAEDVRSFVASHHRGVLATTRRDGMPQLSPVLDLLLLDDTNTRAVAFQLAAVSEHIRHLPRDPKAPSPTREERLIDQAVATLRQVDPHTVHHAGEEGAREVTALLGSIEDDLRTLSETISYFYFSHAELRVS